MAETLYASFADPSLAEKAAGALLDHGCSADDISVVSREPTTGVNAADRVTHTSTVAERGTTTGMATMDRDYGTTRTVDSPSNFANSADRNEDADYSDSAEMDEVESGEEIEDTAKGGITTTTPADAAAGAAKGAVIGLGAGAVLALASLTVPGFGIIGGGALATAIAGAAGATAAGAVAGGVHGYLKDQGVTDEAAAVYEETYQRGGAIVAVTIRPDRCDEVRVRELLAKYGAVHVNVY
jgi:hypothetical protein